MMLINYASKKDLKASVGKPLTYRETSFHGDEYKSNGEITVAYRPAIWAHRPKPGREFFARITMESDLIAKVE